MTTIIKTAPKIKRGTFTIETSKLIKAWSTFDFDVEYVIEKGPVYEAEITMYSVTPILAEGVRQPAEFYEKSKQLLEMIEDEIRFHEFKGKDFFLEYKAEQKSDESRGN